MRIEEILAPTVTNNFIRLYLIGDGVDNNCRICIFTSRNEMDAGKRKKKSLTHLVYCEIIFLDI